MSTSTIDNTSAFAIRSIRHREPFSFTEEFRDWDLHYRQTAAGNFESFTRVLTVPGLHLSLKEDRIAHIEWGACLPGTFVFGIPWDSVGESRFNGRAWCGQIIALRGEQAFEAFVMPMKMLVVALSRSFVIDYLLEVEGANADDWLLDGARQLLVTDSRRMHIIDSLTGLLNACDVDGFHLSEPSIQRALLNATMEVLAALILGNLAPSRRISCEVSRAQVVRRARDYLVGRIEEPVQVLDVCRALNVSRRTLQYSFQDVLKLNPVAYLRLLRLNGARRDLTNVQRHPVQVKDVVARWGFWHLSRFSAEYRQLFHELPSETLRLATGLLPADGREGNGAVGPAASIRLDIPGTLA